MPNKKFLIFILLFTLAFSFSGLLTADYKITQKMNIENKQGIEKTLRKGAQIKIRTGGGNIVGLEFTEFTYISPNAVRLESISGMVTLYKTGGNIYYLFPNKKEYMESDQVEMQKMMDMVSGPMGEITVDINNTGKEKLVGNWNTIVWEADLECDFFKMKTTLYQTMEINLPNIYYEFQKEILKNQGLFKNNIIEAFGKIKGFTVKTDANMAQFGQMSYKGKNIITTMRVISVEEIKLSALLFEIPGDYKRIKFDRKRLIKHT